MYGERIQIHGKIPLKRLYNEQIHVITGHKLSFSQKERARIAVVYCHLNQALSIQAFQFNQCVFDILTNLIRSLGHGKVPERKCFSFFIFRNHLYTRWFILINHISHNCTVWFRNFFDAINFQAKTGVADNVFGVYEMWTRIYARLFANGRGKK